MPALPESKEHLLSIHYTNIRSDPGIEFETSRTAVAYTTATPPRQSNYITRVRPVYSLNQDFHLLGVLLYTHSTIICSLSRMCHTFNIFMAIVINITQVPLEQKHNNIYHDYYDSVIKISQVCIASITVKVP